MRGDPLAAAAAFATAAAQLGCATFRFGELNYSPSQAGRLNNGRGYKVGVIIKWPLV